MRTTLAPAAGVPVIAVERGPNGLYVFVVGDDRKVEMRAVKAGNSGNGQTVILDGLSPGQKVVVAGQYRLQQGSLVEPREADAPAPAKEAQSTPATGP